MKTVHGCAGLHAGGMDMLTAGIPCSRPTVPREAAGTRCHSQQIMLRLFVFGSTANARPGGARIIEYYRKPLSSLPQVYTNTPAELGHQVAATQLTTPDTLPSVPAAAHWVEKATIRPRRRCACNEAATL